MYLEDLFTPSTIIWIAPDGSAVPSEEGNNPRVDPTTRQLMFSDLILNNVGIYTCHAVVNIPKAQIVNHIDEATITITTNGQNNLYNNYNNIIRACT